MKAGYITAIWIALILSVLAIVTVFTVLFDFYIVRSSPLIFAAGLVVSTLLVSLFVKKFLTLQVLRRFGIIGGLLISPALLFFAFIPVAFYYLASEETPAGASGNSLVAVAVCIAALFFFSAMAVYTLPALAIISEGFNGRHSKRYGVSRTFTVAILSVIVISVILEVIKSAASFHTTGLILLLPVLSLLLVLSYVLLNHEFRGDILRKLSSSEGISPVKEPMVAVKRTDGLFRSSLHFHSDYFMIISGNHAGILEEADSNYLMSIVHTAHRDFDPALIPALNAIAASERLGQPLRHEAASVVNNIEKYYSDPKRNSDILMQTGVAEKTAGARAVLLSKRVPMVSEVLRLLHDGNPDIRRIGLAAIGRFGIREMIDEVIEALSVPGTEKEAFYLLQHFGPDAYKNVIGSHLKHSGRDFLNLMIIRLVGSVQSRDTISILEDFVGQGTINIRLMAMHFLRENHFNPNAGQRKKLTETVMELLGNMTAIISMQMQVRKYKFFLLESALEGERGMNQKLIDSVLPFIIGPEASASADESDRREVCIQCKTGC